MTAQAPVQISQIVRDAVLFNAGYWRNRPRSTYGFSKSLQSKASTGWPDVDQHKL